MAAAVASAYGSNCGGEGFMWPGSLAQVMNADRVKGKAKRIWLEAPGVRAMAARRYGIALRNHESSLPRIVDRRDAAIIEEMRRTGICTTDLTEALSSEVRAGISALLLLLADCENPQSATRLPADVFASNPALFRWGVSDRFLDMAENYIGLPVRYLGVEMKRERCSGSVDSVRKWHMDIEDRRIFKVIIYLSDVDDDSGPFEFISSSPSRRAAEHLAYSSGFISDRSMADVVSRHEWEVVTGNRFTAIFADTRRVFHRIRPPVTHDRYSMTFAYTSRNPWQTFPEYLLPAAIIRGLVDDLSPRQKAAALRHK